MEGSNTYRLEKEDVKHFYQNLTFRFKLESEAELTTERSKEALKRKGSATSSVLWSLPQFEMITRIQLFKSKSSKK